MSAFSTEVKCIFKTFTSKEDGYINGRTGKC